MRNSFRPAFLATFFVAALPVVALAHPGHDDHDFTWDFSHLAAHPFATLGCGAVIAVSAVIVWRVMRLSADRDRARK